MRRHLPRLLLTGALLSPVTLYALGLGEIRLNSALNQPFDADIELVAPTAEELSSLQVTLASQDVFSRYGIDRPAFLSSLDFAVSRGRDGRANIKVTSNRSITEPFVTLLVEASWARGRLVREYTVLLDPPVFLPSQPAAPPLVTTPQSGVQGEGRIERVAPPAPASAPAAAPAQPSPPPPREDFSGMVVPAPGSEYLVQRNDTLYRIAESVNPGSRQGVNQAMMALYRANPQAFGGNINRLRAGAVLRIPALDQIQAISGGEAAAEVRRHSAEWSGATTADPAESRLRLVTPEEMPASPGGTRAAGDTTPEQGPGGAGEDARLSLANEGLAQVQQQLDPLPEQSGDTPPVVDPQTPESMAGPDAAVELPDNEPLAEQPPARAPTPEPAAAPEPPAPSLMERLGQYWWALIVLGLVVVIGAVLGVLRRRRAEEDDALLEAMDTMDFDTRHTEADDVFAERAPDAFLAQTGMDREDPPARPGPAAFTPVAMDSKLQSMQPDEAPLSDEAPSRLPLAGGEISRAEQHDALAEADFHMAYGLYDQAAALVNSVLERDPQRRELYLKLLEIYFVWGNQANFLQTARYLQDTRAQAAAGEWDKVLIMGRQLAPGEAMFQASPTAPVAAVDVNLEGGENRVDVDLFTEPGEPTQNLEEFAADTGTGLEFVLDETGQQPAAGAWSPALDPTIRERVDTDGFSQPPSQAEQTAELAIDDLGLDMAAIDGGQGLEDTDEALPGEDDSLLQDDEATQLAPSLAALQRRQPSGAGAFDGDVDLDSTGTIYVDQVDFALGGDTVEQPRPGLDSTASLRNLTAVDLEPADEALTQEQHAVQPPTWQDAGEAQEFSDLGGELDEDLADEQSLTDASALSGHGMLSDADLEAAQHQLAQELELSELEPVTLSEVGTKLDLARAYMDMGDPDGARSILDEVLVEGNASQKQEAQRLLDTIG